LAYKEIRLVDWVCAVDGIVIINVNGRNAGGMERGATGIAERNCETLAAFGIRIINDWNRDCFGSLAGKKAQSAERCFKITARGSVTTNDVAIARAGIVAGGVGNSGLVCRPTRAADSYKTAPDLLVETKARATELKRIVVVDDCCRTLRV